MGRNYLDITEAERISGKRLDRRRRYFVWEGVLGVNREFTMQCTGCYAGEGCRECGGTGKRRSGVFVPEAHLKQVTQKNVV